ncbi:uncharacterized protein LOC121390275 [Gigantopelta aegis]|uniref:uncharacterized protein LOC121390275 n=1 Tax=Gigantopelta aegis TaxID=1735272 RepID=UPI001B88DAF8|nr:uncharacterized protein LOC121390275 [Gigantopelta aegis]
MPEIRDMCLFVVFLVVVTAVPLDRKDEDGAIKKISKVNEEEKVKVGARINKCVDLLKLVLVEGSSVSSAGYLKRTVHGSGQDVLKTQKRRFRRDGGVDLKTNDRSQTDSHTAHDVNPDDEMADARFDKLKHAKEIIWKHHGVMNTEIKNPPVTRFLLKKLAQAHARLFHHFQTNISLPREQDLGNRNHRADGRKPKFTGMTDSNIEQLECRYLKFYHKRWVLMIASCPRAYANKTLRHQCEHTPLDDDDNQVEVGSIPVQLENGLVYRNLFCALCNGIRNIEAWDVNLMCTGVPPLHFVNGGAGFTLLGEKDDGRYHCRKTLVPILKDKVQLCQITKRRSYRPFALDNELGGQPTETIAYPVSFSILMNFGFDGKAHILFSTTYKEVGYSEQAHRCPETQVYNPDFNICQHVVCPAGYVFYDLSCNPDSSVQAKPSMSLEEELRELDKPEIIKLRANVSENELDDLKDGVYQNFIKESMCDFLNITCDRIKNFTLAPLLDDMDTKEYSGIVGSGTKSLGNVSPFETRHRLPQNAQDASETPKTREDDITMTTTPTSTPAISGVPSATSTPASTLATSGVLPTFISIPTSTPATSGIPPTTISIPTSATSGVSPTTTGIPTSTPVTSGVPPSLRTKRTPTSKQTTAVRKRNKPSGNRTVVVEIRFVLMPLEKDIGRGEGFVSNVTQRMKERIEQHKFTLSLNGTQLRVLTMDQVSSVVQMDTFCTRGIKQMYFDDEFEMLTLPKDNDTVDVVYVNSTKTKYWPGMYDLTVLVAGNVMATPNITHKSKYVFVCVMPRIANSSCGRLNFTHKDYTLLPNKSIAMSNRLYSMDEYYFIDDRLNNIEICIPEEFYSHREPNVRVVHACDKGYEFFQKAEGYLTAVLGRLSIVAMTTVLLTYILIKKLRNLPGVNTMNLTFAILAGQVIFILGENSELQWLCSLVAVSLHYFILASFFWMNVMTFDLFKTFANKCILTQIRSKSKFMWRYSLYAWGSPLVIVLICAFVDFSGLVEGFQIGYGGIVRETNVTDIPNESLMDRQNDSLHPVLNNTDSHTKPKDTKNLGCWIQNPVATLIVFGGPLLTIFIVNGFLFVCTILCIQETARLAHINTRRSSMSHMTGRYHVMLYVRMSTVMGFTWIFGLASSIVSGSKAPPSEPICYTVHALGILFTLFNCSQGLFILFAFVAKRRVFYMYKDLSRGLVHQFKRWKVGNNKNVFGRPSSTSSASSSTTSISHIT